LDAREQTEDAPPGEGEPYFIQKRRRF